MEYLLLKKKGEKWIAEARVKASIMPSQRTAINFVKKSYKNISGEYWLFPVTHSAFYTFSKGKLIEKQRYYGKKEIF